MTNPFSSDGAKAPAKPYTVTEGERRIRSFVLRRAAKSSLFEDVRRVATRWPDPTAGCDGGSRRRDPRAARPVQ